MLVVDAQLHAWVPPSDRYPWDEGYVGGLPDWVRRQFEAAEESGEKLVAMMDGAGVDCAILTSPTLYGADHSYAFDVAERFAGRFGVVGPLRPEAEHLEARIRTFRDRAHGIGVRVVVWPGAGVDDEGHRRIFATAEVAGVPVFVTAMGMLRDLPAIARDYPGLQIVVDHLGVATIDPDADRVAMLRDLLPLSEYANVVVKCTSAPELSQEAYPFADLWPHLHPVIDAFGAGRVMWGTDYTQHRHELEYAEAVDYMRETGELAAAEKEMVMGRTAQNLFGFPA
jgi:predicted TIM-barrel fold metal-dependent hydrolase